MAKEKKSGTTAGAPLDPTTMSRRRQIIETYKLSTQGDPALPWWLLGSAVVFGGLGFALFYWLPPSGQGVFNWILSALGGLIFGMLGTLVVFSRRAERAAYQRMDGQLGAGARALTTLRRGWRVEEVVAFTKQQDLVHRVVGPPGVVLVAEGNPNRVRPLLTSERKRHQRVLADLPVHEIVVGNDEGQVPLARLTKHLRKMKRQVKPAEITDLLNRLRALDAQRPKVPLPKGPVPTSMKGMRQNMRGR